MGMAGIVGIEMQPIGLIALVIVAGLLILWARSRRRHFIIPFGTTGLLYKKGRFERELEPGVHRLFDWDDSVEAVAVPTATTALYGSDITVLTKDQFSFRMTLHTLVKITDARGWYENRAPEPSFGFTSVIGQVNIISVAMPIFQAHLNAAVLQSVGARSLEEFLADPRAGLDAILASLAPHFPGVTLEELLLTQITLPPEIRKMFTEVERAKREGQAALERARAEQASLRALANAARALQSNPQLAQLRMLQAMETARGSKTFILGPTGDVGVDVTGKVK